MRDDRKNAKMKTRHTGKATSKTPQTKKRGIGSKDMKKEKQNFLNTLRSRNTIRLTAFGLKAGRPTPAALSLVLTKEGEEVG